MSSVMARTDVGISNINMIGYRYGKNKLTKQDIILAYSHPYNDDLEIPSKKKFRMYNFVLRELQNKSPLKFSNIAKITGIHRGELKSRIENYLFGDHGGNKRLVYYNEENDELGFNEDYIEIHGHLLLVYLKRFARGCLKIKTPVH